MKRLSTFVTAMASVALLAACGGDMGDRPTVAAEAAPGIPGMAPLFEVDPLWPKPLPNHWILGSTIGVAVDSRDHVWIIHRAQAR